MVSELVGLRVNELKIWRIALNMTKETYNITAKERVFEVLQ